MVTKDITRTASNVSHAVVDTTSELAGTAAQTARKMSRNVRDWAEDVNWRPILLISSVFAVAASAWAIRRLLQRPDVRHRLGLDKKAQERQSTSMSDEYVDVSSEDSFPASDAPSFTSTTSLGHPR